MFWQVPGTDVECVGYRPDATYRGGQDVHARYHGGLSRACEAESNAASQW